MDITCSCSVSGCWLSSFSAIVDTVLSVSSRAAASASASTGGLFSTASMPAPNFSRRNASSTLPVDGRCSTGSRLGAGGTITVSGAACSSFSLSYTMFLSASDSWANACVVAVLRILRCASVAILSLAVPSVNIALATASGLFVIRSSVALDAPVMSLACSAASFSPFLVSASMVACVVPRVAGLSASSFSADLICAVVSSSRVSTLAKYVSTLPASARVGANSLPTVYLAKSLSDIGVSSPTAAADVAALRAAFSRSKSSIVGTAGWPSPVAVSTSASPTLNFLSEALPSNTAKPAPGAAAVKAPTAAASPTFSHNLSSERLPALTSAKLLLYCSCADCNVSCVASAAAPATYLLDASLAAPRTSLLSDAASLVPASAMRAIIGDVPLSPVRTLPTGAPCSSTASPADRPCCSCAAALLAWSIAMRVASSSDLPLSLAAAYAVSKCVMTEVPNPCEASVARAAIGPPA